MNRYLFLGLPIGSSMPVVLFFERLPPDVGRRWDPRLRRPPQGRDHFQINVINPQIDLQPVFCHGRDHTIDRLGCLVHPLVGPAADMPQFLAFKNLEPLVFKHLGDLQSVTLKYRTERGHLAHGIRGVTHLRLDKLDRIT